MGISAPSIGYTGYGSSDNTLQKDTAIYTRNSIIPLKVITGIITTDLWVGTKLRFKYEGKIASSGIGYFRLIIGEELLWISNPNTTSYVLYQTDLEITRPLWAKNNKIDVWISSSSSEISIKNFEICGVISPIAL